MKIEKKSIEIVTIPDDVVLKIIRGIMENFPEASASSLQCTRWNYSKLRFVFRDFEEDASYKEVDKDKLLVAFPLMFTDKWCKGFTKVPMTANWDDWENWLCQADASDFDGFVQLAIFGEVIYG